VPHQFYFFFRLTNNHFTILFKKAHKRLQRNECLRTLGAQW
jgi:hypothetical protein